MRNRRFAPALEIMEFRFTPSGAVPMGGDGAASTSGPMPWVDLSGQTSTPNIPYYNDSGNNVLITPMVPVDSPDQS